MAVQQDKPHPAGPRREPSSTTGRGTVVVLSGPERRHPRGHESVTRSGIAQALAQILGFDFAGEFDAARRYGGPLYFVPSDTLAPIESAHVLGIRSEQDLFGGVVPFDHAARKTITHGLVAADSAAPDGWSAAFGRRVRAVVLPGFSVFTPGDARIAARRLLRDGPVRIKPARGSGGAGQSVVDDLPALDELIWSMDHDALRRDGLVLERHLVDVTTRSVGQVRVGKLLATYFGLQRLTRSNHGHEVYGGSTLTVVRGGYDALLPIASTPEIRTAIAQARTYHDAALRSFAGMFASRCNYDVAQGVDRSGRWHSGVLEQSWRIGGASGAEVAALRAFRDDPALDVVVASTTELYGADTPVPAGALVYFRDTDERAGPLTKYSELEPHASHP